MKNKPPVPIEINKKTRLFNQHLRELKDARRVVYEGYPREKPFETPEEIYDYLNQDLIDCLLCGRRLGSLPAHLARIHRMSTDDYKTKYGLPYSRGLTCAGYTESLSKSKKEWVAKNPEKQQAKLEQAWATQNAGRTKPRTSGLKHMITENKRLHFVHHEKWDRKALEPFVQKIEAGARFIDLIADSSQSAVREALNRYPDLKERYVVGIKQSKAQRARDCVAIREARRHA